MWDCVGMSWLLLRGKILQALLWDWFQNLQAPKRNGLSKVKLLLLLLRFLSYHSVLASGCHLCIWQKSHILFPINLLQVVRREGIDFWHDLLPSLITLSHNGPAEVNFSPSVFFGQFLLTGIIFFDSCWRKVGFRLNLLHFQAELVVMILRWLPEDITVHNEDLEGK